MRDLLVSAIWVVGLCLCAAVIGARMAGTSGSVFAVGVVLFIVGSVADFGGLL